MPTRMCAVCRGRFDKSSLNRIVKTAGGEIVVDKRGKVQSRGLYICSSCVDKAAKKRVLERAYKCRVDSSVYDRIMAEVGENTK